MGFKKSCLQIKLQLSWNRLPDQRYCRPCPFKAPASQDNGGSTLCQVQSCLGSQTSVRPRYDNNLPIILYWKPYWLLMLKIYLICVELTCIEGKLFCQTCLWRWQTVTGFNANILCILLVLISKQINWENKLSVNVLDWSGKEKLWNIWQVSTIFLSVQFICMRNSAICEEQDRLITSAIERPQWRPQSAYKGHKMYCERLKKYIATHRLDYITLRYY